MSAHPPALVRLFTAAAVLAMPFGCIVDQGDPDAVQCPDCPPPDAGVDGMAGEPAEVVDPEEAPACLDATAPLDLLLVIDNSGSMCEEQDALGKAFEALHAAIGDRDWRMAVVSTDMNPAHAFRGAFGPPVARPVPSLNCIDDEGQPHVPDTEDCRDVDGVPVLDSRFFEPDELARRFRCMVNLGTQGDGFEKALAAADLALDCAGPNADLLVPCGAADAQFLRPGAALAVIYVGDEDDCSTGMGAGMQGGPPLCENVPDEDCDAWRSQNNHCAWYPDALEPVQSFVDALRAANPLAAGVTALTLSGPRFEPIDGHPVRFVPGEARGMCLDDAQRPVVSAECCPEGACPGDIAAVCEGPHGAAFAGNRLRAMAEAFPGGCADCDSICDPDGLSGLAEQLAAKLEAALPPPCE